MVYPSEKFCLRWNDFEKNIVNSYTSLRTEPDFSDVTLISEENHLVEAHRVILTACSPFFSSMLKGNKHSHPMIYMRGLKAKDLVAIIDFIYLGEADIFQEDLDVFLVLAEELQLKGLAGSTKEEESLQENYFLKQTKIIESVTSDNIQQEKLESIKLNEDPNFFNNSIVGVQNSKLMVTVDPAIDDLEAKINSMIEEVDDGINNRKCRVCGKTTKCGQQRRAMTRHIETHIEGVTHTCNQCGIVSRSSNALTTHVSLYHRK